MKIDPSLLAMRDINGYTDSDHARKTQFHRRGAAFLRDLAAAIGLEKGTFDVRSNKGGPAVSGEVTLHADKLYVQLSESFPGPGIGILYRSCNGRKDYSGGRNNQVKLADLQGDAGDHFITQCRDLAELLADNKYDQALNR